MELDMDELTPTDGASGSVATMDLSERPVKPATLLSYEEVRPQSFSGRRKSTRLQEYRRKLRRRRNRRFAFGIAATATTLALGLTYKISHPDFSFQQYVAVEDLNVSSLDNILNTAANGTQHAVESTLAAILGKKETVEKPKEEKKKKSKPEKKKPEAPKVEAHDPTPTPVEPSEPTENSVVVVEKVKEEVNEAAQIVVAQKPKERRPPLCNVPLAYIHPRCFRLARSNPVFNLHALVQDMMQ